MTAWLVFTLDTLVLAAIGFLHALIVRRRYQRGFDDGYRIGLEHGEQQAQLRALLRRVDSAPPPPPPPPSSRRPGLAS